MSKEFIWNDHKEVQPGSHAIISASRHNILGEDYTTNQFDNFIRSQFANQIGTAIHELAADYISRKKRLSKTSAATLIDDRLYKAGIPSNVYDPKNYVDTVVPYISDAIGFDMRAEQVLKYSRWAFGTTDAIRVNFTKHELRIHDLKTGKIPASLDQLIMYAAFFFLEYHFKPGDFKVTLCIYQNGDILTGYPQASDILPVMDRIKTLSDYYERNYTNG